MEDAVKSSYVYTWTRPDTGDVFYVGLGSTEYRDVTPKRGNKIFMRIVAKLARLGLEPAIERIADNLTLKEARELERSEIARIGRKDLGVGPLANLTDGGEGNLGWIPSPETRSRISAAGVGRRRSAESRAKQSAATTGRVRSAAHCASLSEALRGKPKSVEHREKMRGAKTEEHRANLSRAKMGTRPSVEHVEKLRAGHHKTGPQSNNASGYKGVSPSRRDGTWIAQIRADTRKHLGTFTTPEDAAKAYDIAAVDAWGIGNCYLNFPELFDRDVVSHNDNNADLRRYMAS